MHPAPRTADEPRWVQLTYASFDPGNGAGGWQVKQTTGGPSRDEQREISAHLVTAFDAHAPLPEYPTPADIAAQPRRCAYVVGRDGPVGVGNGPWAAVTAGCLVHAVQAGSDSTGRPGNVFSHVVLDRRPREAAPPLRPVELWRSFDLLTPFGASAVLAATLRQGDRPEPSGFVGRDLVLSFVFDASTWRMGVLSVLLDAVDASLRGGRRVVLVTSGPDQAAMWIGAVSWLMSPGTARALSWSVYERASRLWQAFDRGVHLVAVPRADAPGISHEHPGYVVIDDAEFPSLGEVDAAPHRTAAGHEIAATAWSHLVQESLVDEAAAESVLARADALAATAGDWGLAPAWPLALARLETAADGDDTRVAARTAVADAPPSRPSDPSIERLLRGAIGTGLGPTVDDAWRSLEAVPTGSVAAAIAADAYLVRVVGDAQALLATEPVRAPMRDGTEPTATATDPDVRRAFDDALAAAGDADDAALVLRIVDLAVRAGVTADADVAHAVLESVSRVVAPKLLAHCDRDAVDGRDADAGTGADRSDDLADLLHRAGRLDVRVHRVVVPEAIRDHLRSMPIGQTEPGELLAPIAAEWLTLHGTEPALESAPDALGLELALSCARHRADDPGVGHAAALALLARYGTWYGVPEHLRVVTPTSLWRPEELADLESRFPGALPDGLLVPTLACAAPSDPLEHLVLLVSRRGGTRTPAVTVARARLEGMDASTDAAPGTDTPATLAAAGDVWASWPGHVQVDVFAPVVLEAAIVEASASPAAGDWPHAVLAAINDAARMPGVAERVVRRVAARAITAASNPGVRPAVTLAALAALTIDGTVSFPVPQQSRLLAALVDDEGTRILDRIAATIVADHADEPTIARDAARLLAAAESTADDHRRIDELERAVTAGLHGDRATDRRRGTPRRHPFRSRPSKES